MKVVIIIVTYNNEATINACITSLEKQKLSQVLVVDNASTDGTIDAVRKDFKTVKLFSLPQNRGYAGGNNFGIEKALELNCEFVLILNPDTVLEPNAITRLLSATEKHEGNGIFGPKILMEDGKRIWSIGGELDKKRYTAGLIGYKNLDNEGHKEKEVDFVSGTCMLIPRKLLEKDVRYYEKYFLYYEDVEFCVRAKQLGFHSFVVPTAKIVHLEESQKFTLKDYYLVRNHLLFVERNAPLRVKLHELIRLPKTLYEHVTAGEWNSIQGIKDYFVRRFGMH